MKLYGKRCEDKKNIYESDPPEKETIPRDNNIKEEEYTPENIPENEIREETPPLPDNDSLPEDTAFSRMRKMKMTAPTMRIISTHVIPNLICHSLNTDFGISEHENDSPPEYVSIESLGNQIGYIIVNVRAGDESSAVEGATVLVTAIVDGNRIIIASGQTNSNGTTPIFEVPVPDFSFRSRPIRIQDHIIYLTYR